MVYFRDRAEIKNARARITPEGYFVADALVARANNIQEYRARELGLTDRDPEAIVRVFRPEAEVFAVDSLRTASRLPVTLDHPPVMVDASNWKEYAKGETGEEILRDGEFMRVPVRVTDAGAVGSVRTDRKEFSLGYTADLKLEAGVFDGQEYDASISTIRYNHLAACRAARGGSELRIIDESPAARQPEGNPMPKIVLVDGLPVDVANADVAETLATRLVAARDTANSALEASQAALRDEQAKTAELTAKVATLTDELGKSKLTPAALRDAAASYSRTINRAKALGVTVTDEMDESAIHAAAVSAKLGDAAKGYTAEQNAVAFAALAATVTDAAPADSDPLRAALRDAGPANIADAKGEADKARTARLARYETAYKGA